MADETPVTPIYENPASYETNSMGYKLAFKGPATVEDFDRRAGKTGACLQGGVDDELYRGTLPTWQEEFGTKVLVPRFGPRAVNTEATDAAKKRAKDAAKVEDVLETWTRYNSRVVAQAIADATAGQDANTAKATEEALKAELNAEAQRIADTVFIDPSPSTRAKGPSKQATAKAESILTREESAIEDTVAKMLAVVPEFQLERDDSGKPEVKSLARMVDAYTDAAL